MVGMVLSVRIGIVNCLERYLVYRLGWTLQETHIYSSVITDEYSF
jgi:hypothetical protein